MHLGRDRVVRLRRAGTKCSAEECSERHTWCVTVPVVSKMRLTKTFGPIRALDGLDLDVMPGEVLGVLGPNVVLLAVGALALLGGTVAFARRDIAG